MQKNQILAFLIAIAVSFLILFWLSYRQESQLREFRIRQSKLELRILALEQEKHLGNAEMHPNLVKPSSRKSRGASNKVTEAPQQPVTVTPHIEDNPKKEMSDDMKKEIEFIERELETMGRILEEEPINVSVVKLVNKHADNTYIDIDKITNVVDDSEDDEQETDEIEDTQHGGNHDDDQSDAHSDIQREHQTTGDHSENEDNVSDTSSTRNANTEITVDDHDNDNEDEDVCSSEMEIIIQANKNHLGDSDTHSSHVVVEDTDSQFHSQKTESQLSHIENEIEAWMNNYKVNELKDLCRNNGLPQTGLKRELIDRLIHKGVQLSHNP